MKTGSGITKLLQQVQASEDTGFAYDEAALDKAVAKNESAYANIVIKVLSGLGGFLATLAFLGFLFLAGLYKSEEGMALMGIVFIGLALGGSRMADHSFFDTVALTLYLSGYVLVATGVTTLLHGTGTTIVLLFMLISVLGIFIAKGFMMVMLSVLIFNGSFFCYFPVQHVYGNVVLIPMLFFLLGLFLLTACESRWISYSAWLNKLYKPFQSGFFFSFLAALLWSAHAYAFDFYQGINPRVFSICIIAGIAILIGKIVRSLGISRKMHIAGIYLFMLAILLPALYFPYIPGALFLLLLSVHYGYKLEAGLSVAVLAYFIVKYYYDLQLSLLQKSGLLFFPGILLLLVWFYYNRQLKKDEKI